MSFSQYPNALDDSISLPPSLDLITPVKAEVVNRLRDAALAIEVELGIQPSSTFGTVRARLDAMQSQITTVAQDLDAVEAELGVNPSGTFSTVVLRLDDIGTTLVALSATNQVVTPIISGSQETNSSTFTAKGGGILNPTSLGHPSVTFTLEVLLQTTDADFDGYFELFNITEGLSVSHDIIQTIATTPTLLTAILTVGGADLPASQVNVLEGRIRLTTGAAASDRVVCKYAAIRSVPT